MNFGIERRIVMSNEFGFDNLNNNENETESLSTSGTEGKEQNINEDNEQVINRENNQIINNENQQKESSTYRFWAEQITSPKEFYNQNDGEQNNAERRTNDYQSNDNYSKYSGNATASSNNAKHQEKIMKKAIKKTGPLKKAGKLLAGALVFGIVAGITFLGFNLTYYKINPDAAPFTINIGSKFYLGGNSLNLGPANSENQIAATTISKDIIQQETDITSIVDKTMPSIVTIHSTYTETTDWFGQQYSEEYQGSGSGIIVGKNEKELLIATNNHVVEGAEPITVTFIDDTKAEAIIKGTDAVADLAVISIDLSTIKEETLKTIQIATLGDSDDVKVGQMAIAIGNALGYGQSVTVGYISAKDRAVAIEGNTMVLLQTDAAINPGNSGGALLNMKGEVIGINSVKYASSEVEGMGYAIPISRAMPIINELMNRETLAEDEKGYLGVYIRQVTEEVAQTYNWPVGVYVISTIEGGAAESAGIIAGDIITKVNQTEVTAESQLQEKVNSYRAGTEVTLTVMRMENGQYIEREIVVTLGKSATLNMNQ
jgi:serine protease Do